MNTYVFIIKQLPIKHNDIIIANIATDSTETKIANWLRNLDPEITTQIHFRILRNVNWCSFCPRIIFWIIIGVFETFNNPSNSWIVSDELFFSGSFRHIGQLFLPERNHFMIHLTWNLWLHSSRINRFFLFICSKHIEHWSVLNIGKCSTLHVRNSYSQFFSFFVLPIDWDSNLFLSVIFLSINFVIYYFSFYKNIKIVIQ